jgi:Fe-S cluster assembly protein SufD
VVLTKNISNTYQVDFKKLPIVPHWLQEIRNTGMQDFLNVGFPTARKGNEKWKYTNVSPIAGIDFRLSENETFNLKEIKEKIFWDEKWINLIFINGQFNSYLSDEIDKEPISIVPISALSNNLDIAQNIEDQLGSLIDLSDEGFAALNTAFVSDGITITIPENTMYDKLINVVFFNSGGLNAVSHPRVFVNAGSNSSTSIMETYLGGSQNISLTNSVSEIILNEGAIVNHYRLLDESSTTYDVGYGRVKLGKKSQFMSRSFFKGAAIGRYDLNVLIDGEEAYCDLQGLYLTTGSQHMDNFINIDHVAPNGKSNLLYKGILDGKSRAVFGGTVVVRREAQKTNSIQSDKNLLLSSEAEIDSKPALYIYADDVKCAHGATAGNVDAETIFYMLSRGINIEDASKLLLYGFAAEIINSIAIIELRNKFESYFLSALPDYKFEF